MDVLRIPIAEDCYSTFEIHKLKTTTLADFTYFDWIVLSPVAVLRLFENDFADYFERDNLVKFDDNKVFTESMKNLISVLDTKYDILYFHHFDSILKDYRKLRDAFDIMLEKMRALMQAKNPIEFYYRPVYYQSYKKRTSDCWGEESMLRVFPPLKGILMERYGYADDDIKLVILPDHNRQPDGTVIDEPK
jgi:hypothetical protein